MSAQSVCVRWCVLSSMSIRKCFACLSCSNNYGIQAMNVFIYWVSISKCWLPDRSMLLPSGEWCRQISKCWPPDLSILSQRLTRRRERHNRWVDCESWDARWHCQFDDISTNMCIWLAAMPRADVSCTDKCSHSLMSLRDGCL